MEAEGEACDVCIVGYGPVGATLAHLLSLGGLSVLVLEREAACYRLPRAVHFDDEVMRVFQAIGLADDIAQRTHVSPGMRFIDANGRLLLDWGRPLHVGAQGWHASYRFHQPELEGILRDAAARHPNIEVHLRAEVFAIAQDADGADISYEDLSNGRLLTRRARYVVGCDGARSLVRRLIGSGIEDLGFHEPWLVVDVILKRAMPQLGDYSLQHCDPARSITYVRGIGDRRRWEIALRPGEDPTQAMEADTVWRLLARWVTPADAELERAACYTFHSTLATQWRRGRLFIAGDSAHQMPPFLGQGMCAGIRDAANLAWKLAHILHGKADQALLDTYQAERAPHAREYIALAVRLGGLINTKAIEAALPGGFGRLDVARMETVKPRLGPGLAAGLTALTGQVAPQPRLAEGALLDDHVGYGFAALLKPSFSRQLTPKLFEHWAQRGIAVVTDESPALQHWLDAADIQGAMVRPDRYILGAARTIQDMEALTAAI